MQLLERIDYAVLCLERFMICLIEAKGLSGEFYRMVKTINLPIRNPKLYQKFAINNIIYFVCKVMHNENIYDSLVTYCL